MNNRIKELIDKATIPVIETNDYNGMAYETYQFSRELFAELIVGECYLWAKENGGLGCEEDFEALKEHFGVE